MLDEEWGEFLTTHDFLVGISIDGPQRLHDRFRNTRADGPIFKAVIKGLSVLQEYGVEHNALCVVNAINSQHPLEVYEFFKDLNVEWIQFIPLVEPLNDETPPSTDGTSAYGVEGGHDVPEWVAEHGGRVEQSDRDYDAVVEAAREAPVTDRSVHPATFGQFLCTIFDEWVRTDVGQVSVRIFDQCLERVLSGSASLCVFNETCGSSLAMEHNGDIYACDHFVDPGFERGNIHETHLADLVEDPAQHQFGEYKSEGLPSRCRTCPVRKFCNGGCPKNWHLETPAGEPGLNYLCAGYRRFFTYVQPYLDVFTRTVENGKSLRAVPRRVRALDRRSA